MKMLWSLSISLIFLVSFSVKANAAPSSAGQNVVLEGGVFDPLAGRPAFAETGKMRQLSKGAVPQQYGLVQFFSGQAPSARKELGDLGLSFLGPVPESAFLVRLDERARGILNSHPAVRWVGDWEPAFKIQPRLWPGSTEEIPEFTVVFFPGENAEKRSRAFLGDPSGAVRTFVHEDATTPKARFSLPRNLRDGFLATVAASPAVYWIEPYAEPRLHNIDSSGPIQGNQVGDAGRILFQKGLTGTGQVVAVADSGCDDDMCFFRNLNGVTAITDASMTAPPALGPVYRDRKVLAYWIQPGATAYDNNATCGVSSEFHGTHTSATALGDDLATPSTPLNPGIDTGDGMAPNAQLLFQDIGDDKTGCLSGIGDPVLMLQQAADGGARIHSDSWGGSTGGAYSSDDRNFDRFLFDDERLAVFVSAGNDGVPTSIGSPGVAKNVVTVGALGHGSSTSVAYYSSRGPTKDGRIKPDVMAPGSNIVSASGNTDHTDLECFTKSLSGTSMACPTAAGGSALLRQYFSDGFYPGGARNPGDRWEVSGPVVKAALLNGTLPLPLSSDFGNANYGWGRVFLDSNLYFQGDARKLRVFSLQNTQGLLTGENRSYEVYVGAGQEFRATLVWADPEGTLGAGKALVNDLDLTVTGPGGTFKGNVLNGSGISTTGGSEDRTNNVEQVRLLAPEAGTYTISVNAPSVPGTGRAYTDRQGFALALSMEGCSTSALSAPTGISVSNLPVMGAKLSFTPAAGSRSTQVYRLTGSCSAGPGSAQFVGSATGSTFEDPRAQGGITYSYWLRGADTCGEGPLSGCVQIMPSGRCDLLPEFAGIESAVAQSPRCTVRLAWSPGTVVCPTGGTLHYNIYRGTTPDFVPSQQALRASVTGQTTFEDSPDATSIPKTYYYIVRAEDATKFGPGPSGGNEDSNLKRLFATPVGSPSNAGTFRDDGGDTGAFMTAQSPWYVSSRQAFSGKYAYHAGNPTGAYPPNTCASLTSPALAIQAASTLSYQVNYNLEEFWDGVVVEISSDAGATWQDLSPESPSGYPGVLSDTGKPPVNACKYPETQRAFSGPSNNENLSGWKKYETSLARFEGKTVQIRWRLTTDPGMEYEGFYLDDIQVTNVIGPGTCRASLPMYLSKQRVKVEVSFTSQYTGQSGEAVPLPQKDEFGYFYFSNPNNPEVFVKVLDFGADSPYLIFYAGLTDYEYTVRFTNVATGKSVSFLKPAGAYDGGADNTSLPHAIARAMYWSRDGGTFEEIPAAATLMTRESKTKMPSPSLRSALPVPDGSELPLSNGSVAVSVDWKSQYTGQTGIASPIPQKDEFGYFYFSDPNNPEVFVKVLDFGASNPYLIFYAGLTDFEYTVKFRNIKTGQIVSFTKDAGKYNGGADNSTLLH